jgi:outer membrane protein
MNCGNKFFRNALIVLGLCIAGTASVGAQQTIDLNLQSSVQIAMESSYRIKQLQMGISQTRYRLQARQAGLKSNVYVNLRAPNFNYVAENKWNSTLLRDEIIKSNTGLWQMDLSVRQPLILFGYPTNGYLSLNNKMYRYTQKTLGNSDLNFYNRYFLSFSQPLFQPNTLKNNIEEAELDLENNEFQFLENQVSLIEDIGYQYYNLFQMTYRNTIYGNQVANLEKVSEIAKQFAAQDTTHSIEAAQVQVEIANARDQLLTSQSNLRLGLSQMKQRLRLDPNDSLSVDKEVKIVPINVDTKKAIEYGFNLRPRLRMLSIDRRQNEIDLQNTKGSNAFRMNIEMTYGLEREDQQYDMLWDNLDNSYSFSVNAYIPIWDWGQRKANIKAQEINLQRTDLSIEETRNQIESEITNSVETLMEYQRRTLSMKQNCDLCIDLTQASIAQYKANLITIQDLLQAINRQTDTENNFLSAYLGYRRALIGLMADTYYDFEDQVSLLDKYGTNQEAND